MTDNKDESSFKANQAGMPPKDQTDGESKLDLWIKQKLQEGSSGESPQQNIVHLPAPQKPFPQGDNIGRQQQSGGQIPGGQQNQGKPPQSRFLPRKKNAGGQPQPRSARQQPHSRSTGGQPQQHRINGSQQQHQFRHRPERFTGGQGGTNRQAIKSATQPTYAQKKIIPQRPQQHLFHHDATSFKHTQYLGKLRIIPLSGLNEVGRNCMILEYNQEIIVIDLGFQFPEADFLGVDYVIPDTTYLEERRNRIRGIIFTHGHLDHIGAVPYIIPKLNYPEMYGTQLTMGLIGKKLKEFGIAGLSKVNVIKAEDKLKLGPFEIDFFNVTHSIPDSVGIIIKTPAGNIVHTGDFKFDLTPAAGQNIADFAKISALSHQDIGALFIDSTNAQKPGHTITEQKIGESLDAIVKNTESRILIASFASQIGRIQQIVNIAQKYHRKILISGRSLEENFEMASKLGYLRYPPDLVLPIHKAKKIHDHEALILTTGSQGEDVSALTRMSMEEHPLIKIKKGDTVIISASPIPGNERAVFTVINNLTRLGARVIDNKIMDVHASGHAQEEDLKMMMTLVRPRVVVPIHGEFYMRAANKQIAMSLGYTDGQSIIVENGDVMEMENNEIRVSGEKVSSNFVLIDGLGVGDIGAQVIMDRQTLAENGVVVVMIPVDTASRKLKGDVEIISRGFIYMKEAEALVAEMSQQAAEAYRKFSEKRDDAKRGEAKKYVRDYLDKFIHEKLERYPLILPIIIEK